MKSIFCKVAFLAAAFVVVLSAARLTAYADGGVVRVVPDSPYWFHTYDPSINNLTNPTFFGQNTVQKFELSGDISVGNAEYVMILHPEFYPEPDEPKPSVTTTAIEKFLVWNNDEENPAYVPCLDGTMAIFPRNYRMGPTASGDYYLQFDVGFRMLSSNSTPITNFEWCPVYFKIPVISGDIIENPAIPDEEFVGGMGGF
jgi:hypothetical protein